MPKDVFLNKVAIVTGGASGIGRSLCEELGRRGAVVVVADINAAGAKEVTVAMQAAGCQAEAVLLDVSLADDVDALVRKTAREHGHLDYIFNNAGVSISGEVRDLELEHWQRIIDINLMGVLHGTMSAYKVMVAQRSGHIVNIASLAGLAPMPMTAPYSTTKHAVVGLSASLWAEAHGLGVKVSVVCPGFVRTGIFDNAIVVGADKARAFAGLPKKMMDPDVAARYILDRVVSGRRFIVFPRAARAIWLLARLCPAMLAPIGIKMVESARRRRSQA